MPRYKEPAGAGNEWLDIVRTRGGDADVGLLRLGKAKPLVHPGVFGLLRAGFGIWLPAGSLAIRPGRGCLVGCRAAPLVARTTRPARRLTLPRNRFATGRKWPRIWRRSLGRWWWMAGSRTGTTLSTPSHGRRPSLNFHGKPLLTN